MHERIREHIDEYFNNEQNLHNLRQKIFSLEGYRLKSDVDKELADCRKENERAIEDLKKNHEKALNEMAEKHRQELRQQSEQSAEKLSQKEREFADYKANVKSQLEEATKNEAELKRWQAGYGELSKAYMNFSALSAKHQKTIAGIFGGCDTPLDFLCGSIQKGHLEQLWDYVSDELNSAYADEHESNLLAVLFDFSFNAVNRSQREPLFRRLIPNQGAVFDGDTMGRTADSPQLGRVKRLVFAGFAHEVTGNVVRRSLVKLE